MYTLRSCFFSKGGALTTETAVNYSKISQTSHDLIIPPTTFPVLFLSDMQITAKTMQTYDLQKFAISRFNGSTPLLKFPVINANEATKRLRDRAEKGKCTYNRASCAGLSTPFHPTDHDPPDVIGLDKKYRDAIGSLENNHQQGSVYICIMLTFLLLARRRCNASVFYMW